MWLIPLGFLYVWLYNAFPLLVVIAAVYAAAAFLTERRIEWKAVIYPSAGIAPGLIINPYFPQNITFIVNLLAPKIGDLGARVGNEWYPYDTWVLVENSGFAIAAFVIGVFALIWRGQKFDRATLTAFGLALFFGLLTFKSRRFIEYFPAFALIFAALSVSPLLDRAAGSDRAKRLIPIGLLAIWITPMIITLTQARSIMADQSKPAETYAAASYWIAQHAEPGALIFQTDWDDFPRLFFYNTHNTYLVGLDPTYLQLSDAGRYDLWVDITRSIERIVDSFPEEQQSQIVLQLSMVLEAVLSQRLLPALNNKRVVATEIMVVTSAIRNNIREGNRKEIQLMDYKELRELMVGTQLIPRGIRDERVLSAMKKVPRHLFVDESMQHRAYDDMALSIGEGQTISQALYGSCHDRVA